MKNFLKLLGIITLAVIFGFSITACGNGDDDDNDDKNGPAGPNWPAELMPKTDYPGFSGIARGAFVHNPGTVQERATVTFTSKHSDEDFDHDASLILQSGHNGAFYLGVAQSFNLVSVDGKTIKVKGVSYGQTSEDFKGKEFILCTDYTLNNNVLKLTGGAAEFAFFMDKDLTLN